MLDRLAIHQAPERTGLGWNTARPQCTDLIEQPVRKLLINPTSDPRLQLLRGQPKSQQNHPIVGHRRAGTREMRRQRFAGDEIYLERSDQPLLVPWLNPSGRLGVAALQPAME